MLSVNLPTNLPTFSNVQNFGSAKNRIYGVVLLKVYLKSKITETIKNSAFLFVKHILCYIFIFRIAKVFISVIKLNFLC